MARLQGPVVVVDVQPAYNKWCGNMARDLMKALVRMRGPVAAVFVGEGITSDTEDDVKQYWLEHGGTEALLRRTQFVEKSYGFFRDWMDSGVADEVIVEAAKFMREQDLWSSEDLDDALLHAACPDLSMEEAEVVLQRGRIHRPGEIEGVRLFDRASWTTCGGGTNECLKEFELWLASRGVAHQRADTFTY